MKPRIFVPSEGVSSWQNLLADPVKHWKVGYSAHFLAHAWENISGFPASFQKAIQQAGLDLELVFLFPEFQVDLDTAKRPSQNDLFVVARDSKELFAISVEGKVNESFDLEIEVWNQGQSQGKNNRIDFLINKLGLTGTQQDFAKHRYQLFHRTASAILMAEKLHAKGAMMIVHSFSDSDTHFADYSSFVKLFDSNLHPAVGHILKVKTLNSGIDLFLGWVKK